jgi:acetoacetyl-CoA synthetase
MLDRIEDMAKFYLDALKQLQPEGPYILIGYSFGGLVALEMAQCLVEDGKNIALLVLIDTYPHPRYLARRERLRLFVKRMGGHFSRMKRLPVGRSFSHLLRAHQLRLHTAE